MLLYALDLFGTAVFAASGALAAGRRRMGLFGVFVVAGVTAVGGGTLRDVLLDRHPVFWIDDTTYLAVIAAAALLTFLYAQRFEPPPVALPVADALGLAVFTVIGAQVATRAGEVSPAVVVLMGMTTGTVGGILRDVLSGEVPLILQEEIYATASVGGGVAYVLLGAWLAPPAQLLAAAAVVFSARAAGLWWHLHLPAYRLREDTRD